MPDLTPDDVAGREFRSSFRGYEPTEVRSFLSEVGSGLGALLGEIDRLRSYAAMTPPSGDLQAEIDSVSADIHSVLRAASEAAESMRERASSDATRWRSEAGAEAETIRREAAIDSEALRSDAWTVSEQLLTQCQVEAEHIVEDAKKEALRILGEAERESHRLQSGARREAEDLVRTSRMDAEQLMADAKARHDEMIHEAIKQSEAAQERTLALEKRRQELLNELESVRTALTQVEDALDQRREHLGLTPTPKAAEKVVTKDDDRASDKPEKGDEHKGDARKTWVPGETVRVVRPSKPGEEAAAAEITAQPPQPEVKILSGRQFARIKAGLDPGDADDSGEADRPSDTAAAAETNQSDRSARSSEPGKRDGPDEFGGPRQEIPEVEDEGLLDQREEDHSTSVRVVEHAVPGQDDPQPEPEMLEPEDFSGPVTDNAEAASPAPDPEAPDDTEPVDPSETPASETTSAPPSLESVDERSEPDLDGGSAADVADSENGAVHTSNDESEPAPAMVEQPDAEPTDQTRQEAEPLTEPARYNFGDHVVVTEARQGATRSTVAQPTGRPAAESRSENGSGDSEPGRPVVGSDAEDQQSLFGDAAGLFDRLRVEEPAGGSESVPAEIESMMSRRLTTSIVDAFEVRDRLLLPVGNRALRNLKRQLTEAQNVALEEIRLDEANWEPDSDALRDRIRADLVVLFAESFGAGHSAAEETIGGRVPRPGTPQNEVAEQFVSDLSTELHHVVSDGRAAGEGARQLGASLSRVFRGWRTDQSERRVRDLSLTGYHLGLLRSYELADGPELLWKVAGRGCATCRAAADDRPEGLVPPAHPGCECTLGP